MPSGTAVGETARYNKVNSQDPDRDNDSSPSRYSAETPSNIKLATATSSASKTRPSFTRRPHRDLQPSAARAMSLVGLKNVFFRQTVTRVPAQRFGSSETTILLGSSESVDVEAQDCAGEKANQKKCFKVDARVISDATIGLSDGLTVPFALTAGLSALGNTKVVIYGGFAELIAGAISMGLGGYLGAKSEA